ncbi:hypothetical protein GC167_02020 [bacterium]|nr:hypothetical protein [bacterium]
MNTTLKSLRIYLLPVLALLAINYVYFAPVLSGKVIRQDDILLGTAKGKEIRDYREKTGEEPLWTNAMFSGMPTFQISTLYPGNVLQHIQNGLSLLGGRASSIYLIFLLMLGMYLALLSRGVDPWLAALGGLAFGFSAFFIISFGAGHNAKVRAAAYIAPTLMGVLLTLDGKRWLGFALTALFVGLSIQSNHFQITYYEMLLIVAVVVTYGVYAFRNKQLGGFFQSCAVLVAAAVLGIGPNFANLWSTYSYTRETLRGGSSELAAKAESQGGLSYDYAMSWSYSLAETANLIIPQYTGGGMSEDYSKTAVYEKYVPMIRNSYTQQGVPKAEAEKNAVQTVSGLFYWGEESLVNGGYYLGATVFFLLILGLVLLEPKHRAWIIAGLLLSIFLALGRHFGSLNHFLYDHLPIYNKFRVPSMTLVLVFVLAPFVGIWGLHRWWNGNLTAEQKKRTLIRAGAIAGGFVALLTLIFPVFLSFEGQRDAQLLQQGLDIDLLQTDRRNLLRSSGLGSLGFMAAAFAVLWLSLQGKLSKPWAMGLMGLLIATDLWMFDRDHLGAEEYMEQREYEALYAPSPADQQILQDTDPHYRVFNTTAGLTSDSYTSYHHKSIGGYHGAKLSRYQDLVEGQLSKNNPKAFDMLNTKYLIVKGDNGLQTQRNPGACGNAWFVGTTLWVDNADAEMEALGTFDPKTQAVVDRRFEPAVGSVLQTDSLKPSSRIALSEYDPKRMVYQAENTESQPLLAVFSEIYYEGYDHDWKATIDGKPVEHLRVNYLLRALPIPPGAHEVVFEFKPITYALGGKVDAAFSALLLLALGLGVWKTLQPREKSGT